MTETLPDFDIPTTVPEAPAPKKARRKPTKKRSPRSAPPERAAKPARVVKRRNKVDRRTKAFRNGSAKVTAAMADYKSVQVAPKPGEAETVLAILGQLANYDADVKKRILARVGQLA